MTNHDTRTALITGASAGIGEAFARELAKDGYHLVLTARRLDRLEALKKELQESHGIEIMVIGADLADTETPGLLVEKIRAANKTVDFLINNAGYGIPDKYLDVSWETHAAFIQVMVTAVCELTYRLLPDMIERKYGRIINVASVAGLLPGSSGNTLYGAAKSFLIKFTESLWLELEGTGVNVTAVCPGFIFSEFHDVSGTRDKVGRMPSFMWMDADSVARQGIDAVMRGKPVYINGRFYRLIAGLTKLAPGGLALSISRSQSRRFRRD